MADSDLSKEAWQDPAKNVIAANKKMALESVKAVLLVGPDGEPYASSGGSLTVDIGGQGTGSNVTSVSASVSSVTLLASNSDRVEAIIENDSVEDLYVKFGSGATASSYTKKIEQGDAIVVDSYTGIITGVWSAASVDARITEVTP